MDTRTAWVDKNFGDSYNYTEGNTIEITHGNKEEHVKGDVHEYKYGGAREQTTFSKGTLSHWEYSGKGQKVEANWDKSGQFQSFKFAYMGFFTFSVTMPTLPKINIALAMATLDANLKLSAGTSINIDAAAALSTDIKLVGGFYISFESKAGGELKYNEVTNEFKFKAFGLEAAKKDAIEAEQRKLIIAKLATSIKDEDMAIIKKDAEIEKSSMKTMIGSLFIYT